MAEKLVASHSSLTLADADQIIDGALKLRLKHDLLPLAVVVLDSGGHVVSFKREDGCGILRHDIAIGKAPNEIAKLVIKIGRKRTFAPSIAAFRIDAP